MDQNQFKVIFTGQLLDGFNAADVSREFSSKFKLPLAKATKIIHAGREITIKARAPHVKAYKIKSLLESLGMSVKMEPAPINIKKPVSDANSANQSEMIANPADKGGSWGLEPIQQKQAEVEPESSDPTESMYTDLSRPVSVLKKTNHNTETTTPKIKSTGSDHSVLMMLKTFGGWALAGLGVLFILVKKIGIFKFLKVGGLMTTAVFAGYQPDEICMGNKRCEAAVEDQIDDCWDQAALDDYDWDNMSDDDYSDIKPKFEEDFVSCFRYEDGMERVLISPIELRFDLIDNCTMSEHPNCLSLAESQLKGCYDRHQIAYLVSASTTNFYQEISDHAVTFKAYYGCFKDDNGQAIFAEVLNSWGDLY